MKENYSTPELECIENAQADVISTSIFIELPWLPLEDDGKEI